MIILRITELNKKIEATGDKETLVLTNPVGTKLVIRLRTVYLNETETESISKIFYTVTNGSTFHVACPV